MSPRKNKDDSSNLAQENAKLKENIDSLEMTKKAMEKQMKHEVDNQKIRVKIL